MNGARRRPAGGLVLGNLPIQVWCTRMDWARARLIELDRELAASWSRFPAIAGAAAGDLHQQVLAYCDPDQAPELLEPLAGRLKARLESVIARFGDGANRAEVLAELTALVNRDRQIRAVGRYSTRVGETAETAGEDAVVVCLVDAPFLVDEDLTVDARRLAVRSGLKAERDRLGIGTYPEALAAWLEADQPSGTIFDRRGARVERLKGVPSDLDDDQWLFALTLHCEAIERAEGPYLNPTDAVLAARAAG